MKGLRLKSLLVSVFILLLCVAFAQAQPANDDCANAQPIGDVTNLAFDTTLATFDNLGTCMSSPNIWYCYTATCTGIVTVSLCGSSYDTMLAVYDGCTCNPLGTELGCNDDQCDYQSEITLAVTAGNEYLIEVGGYDTDTGQGVLSISCGVPPDDPIEAGIEWLVAQQDPCGFWLDEWSGSICGPTGLALVKLQERAFELGYPSPFHPAYPYMQAVEDGLAHLFSMATIINISPQPAGNPDTNGNGIGVYMNCDGYHRTYETSIAMMAIVTGRAPNRIVNSPGSPVDGWTYKQVVQDMADYMAFGQNDAGNPRGGWGYADNEEWSDNSNSGYAVLGLAYAESGVYGFNCTIPGFVKSELDIWIDYIQNDVDGDADDGGSGYEGPDDGWVNVLKTGNLIFQMTFYGNGTGVQRVQDALDYLGRTWNDPSTDPGWGNPAFYMGTPHYQAMYCIMKGLEYSGIDTVPPNIDWYTEFSNAIVTTQLPDGSWPQDYWGGKVLATVWALLTLEKSAPPEPKQVEHLKWSQPPIEIDPNADIPTYCGWDEVSYLLPASTPVYQNWDANGYGLYWGPGAGWPIADEISLAGTERKLDNYGFAVNSPDGTAPYTVTSELYTDSGGPDVPIPGTFCNHNVTIDGYVWLTCSPGSGVILPDNLWLVLTFDTDGAGWQIGEAAELGSTSNLFALDIGMGWGLYWFGGNPQASFEADIWCEGEQWIMAADDYRCLGAMPVESVRWWGSHQGWEEPDIMPPDLPIAWRIGFWSNVPATQRCDFLYGAATGTTSGQDPSNLYSIDPSTGVATIIGPIGFNGVTGLSFAPDGTLYASANGDALYADGFAHSILLTIDTTTGAGTFVGEISNDDPTTDPNGAGRMPDISFDSLGVLYGYGDRCNAGDSLWTINTSTGAGTFIGPTGYDGGGNGLDFAPNGALCATPYDNHSLVIINPATGAGSDVPGTDGNVPDRINALDFCGRVLYGSWNDKNYDKAELGFWYLVTLDLTTGLPTVIGQTVDGLDALAFDRTFFSHPNYLLRQIEVPADRVNVEKVGVDEYPEIPYYDICYQYYLNLEPDEYFWQHYYREHTTDDIYWLSIAAVYDPDADVPQYPWGWKTRPWSWMDNAVKFWLDENPEPGMVLDPERNMIEPIEEPIFGESFDLAFELDTGPEWIKWEQPFTGIRDWPHYEDEWSVAVLESGIKQPAIMRLVADDWLCEHNEPVTAAAWWGSYIGYEYAACDIDGPWMPLPVKPKCFLLTIWDDVPAGNAKWSQVPDMDLGVDQYSVHVGDAVCSSDFECTDPNPVTAVRWWGSYLDGTDPGDGPNSKAFELVFHYDVPAGMQDPESGEILPYSHPTNHPYGDWLYYEHVTAEERYYGTTAGGEKVYEYIVELNEPFDQEYWKNDRDNPVPGSGIFWLEIAYVVEVDDPPTIEWGWHESVDDRIDLSIANPNWHFGPWANVTVLDKDLAFEIITGSSYSHPGDIIWKYRAYDYDQVLVGYDKHPNDPGADPGREPVFRYSVSLPEEAWFDQNEPNNVYWFGVVAVYDNDAPPNYAWGWTNHEHVYNDNAVAGYLDIGGPAPTWIWDELYDQTEKSEDMSFILFTEECLVPGKVVGGVYITPAMYNLWVQLGKPECWCYDCHSKGDTDGDCDVDTADITTLLAGWGNYLSGFCADTDNDGDVDTADVTNLLNGWNNGCGPGCPVP